MLYVIFGIFALASWLVSRRLKSKFQEYSQVPVGMTGAEVAQRMLRDNGITDVTIRPTSGSLTDFYNPTDKTINLSESVYSSRSVAAAAVAAHETGHAIQHAQAYSFLELRTALVPLQNISSKVLNVIFIAMFVGAIFMPELLPYDVALLIIIAAYSLLTLFSIVTLPVEVNASQRAVNWLTNTGIIGGTTRDQAVDALKWAAYTYFIAALSSIVTLLYYILRYSNSRD
ncbi:MAG: zinc metallopeptidase [Marinilabiliaceae bacterium]|nr:zinc metallopeptidase [Marinilabiliaceae bacterium]